MKQKNTYMIFNNMKQYDFYKSICTRQAKIFQAEEDQSNLFKKHSRI